MLASFDRISSWTTLKPQHSNPKPNPNPLANQLWCIDFLTPRTPLIIPHRLPAFLESHQDCIFEINQLWQSGFSRVYSNCCCSCSFEAEIIEIGQSSHKMYSNKILNFQESTTILNACTKKVWKLIKCSTYIQNHKGPRVISRALSMEALYNKYRPTLVFHWRAMEPTA